MENVILKIFLGKSDDYVHSEFVRFSKGVFENRYLLEGKRHKDYLNIKTSAEFTNFLVQRCLESISGNIDVKGAIIATGDIQKEIQFPLSGIKQYLGIKQFLVDSSIDARKIIELMKRFPRAFYALSFSTSICELKIKARAPKSGKPANSGEGVPKADFCSLRTKDKEIIRDLFFDFPEFDEIKIRHTLMIQEIVLPKDVSDPKLVRELAQRKGIVKRIVGVDGMKREKEMEFIA